ncbi:dihydrofolate reductase [Halovivax ruber XH-70]|uniref:dihydrofolate reductase n=1 Tax=Halovivax ruber (strain DSM 18193 / JCM 13892 / XH-70) TaxID=797302 RepID=L0ICV9_HALRX|nr:dihydrofolate reductase [Halovivax ruber]AGB16066.1 dihydrofolate reductase [Halovivax ruber XH-70]
MPGTDAGEVDNGFGDADRSDPAETAIETALELVAIVAVAENGVIGVDGEMPWHIPEDLAHFKRETTGHPVIMGRVTYESIVAGLGEPLPDRTSIVLTSRAFETPENVLVVDGIDAAVRAAERADRERHDGSGRTYVAGGASVYEQLLPAVDRLVVTEVGRAPEGDAFFPEIDPSVWREVARDERESVTFLEYERIGSKA